MKYLAFIENDHHAWGGTVPELHATVVGSSREDVLRLLAESVAFTRFELAEEGLAVPEAQLRSLADLPADDQADYASMEAVLVEAAPINPVSVEVARTIRVSGLSDREVARRMGASPSSVGRLQDLFYWGHSLPSLNKLAEALGRRVAFRFEHAS